MSTPVPDLYAACEALIRDKRGEKWTRNGRIYVSDLDVVLGAEKGGRCARQYWFTLRDAPMKDATPGELLMFENGDRIHDMLQKGLGKYLEAQGWEIVGVEQRTTPDPDGEVGGRYDLKLRHRETDTVLVFDIKTKRGASFRFMQGAPEGAVVQVESYIEGERLKGNRVDGGGVLVVDREGQNFVMVFPEPGGEPIRPNPERVKKALYVAKYIRDMAEPPPPIKPELKVEPRKGNDSVYLKLRWQASYCKLADCACRAQLPSKYDSWTLVGHVDDDGDFIPKEGVSEKACDWARRLLRELPR